MLTEINKPINDRNDELILIYPKWRVIFNKINTHT